MTGNPKNTSLYNHMVNLNAKIVDFHGWNLPIYFSSILDEHKAIREKCGIFDVSHMGQIFVSGKDAYTLMQRINTNDISKTVGRGVYSHITNEKGNVIDDAITYCIGEDEFLFIANATRIEIDYNWINQNAKDLDVKIENKSDQYSMVAIQGPDTWDLIKKIYPDINLSRFAIVQIGDIFISRTGYTGEDGVEIMCKNEDIASIWEKAIELGAIPCGLGVRDLLRIEAGYLLYGQDIDDTLTPYHCRCGWLVKMNKDIDFIGKDSLNKIKDSGIDKKLSGIELESAGVIRTGNKIFDCNDKEIGIITSGTFSPLFKAIGLGYIEYRYNIGEEIFVEIRDRKVKAKIVGLPFYDNKV